MTSLQKIIKYLAVAFAIFLIVSIISSILMVSYSLFNNFGLIGKNQDVITDELKIISNEIDKIVSLKIDLNYTNLCIKKGNNFEVKTNNTKITFKNNNGNIILKESDKYLLNDEGLESNLVIYIPNNISILDKVFIDSDAGKINIEWLNTKELYFELGAGKVYMENAVVTNNTLIRGGAGKTELVNCNLNNLKANLDVGEFSFNGLLIGNNEINSGVGIVNIYLTSRINDYTINANKGLGSITLNNKELESNKVYGTGDNYLKVNGGIGKININYGE